MNCSITSLTYFTLLEKRRVTALVGGILKCHKLHPDFFCSYLLIIVTLLLALTGCTKGGDVVCQTDPADQASTAPIVTVLYDANALGDGSYNDLIYQGVERAAQKHGLRTSQLSPSTYENGQAFLEHLFSQMANPQDTTRRLFIVAAGGYDDYLRKNNSRLEANPNVELLYLGTPTPFVGKGSTLHMPYYGAMYEAGAIAPTFFSEALVVAANPKLHAVTEAVNGFTDGFNSDHITSVIPDKIDRSIVTEYLSDDVAGGFNVSDTTALRMLTWQEWRSITPLLVPVCGGSGMAFRRLCDLMASYAYMGIDADVTGPRCPFAVVKHIDRAVARCIDQWLTSEGMPKHQTLGLADGYTEVVVHNYDLSIQKSYKEYLTDELRAKIHQEAIRKEAEYGR